MKTPTPTTTTPTATPMATSHDDDDAHGDDDVHDDPRPVMRRRVLARASAPTARRRSHLHRCRGAPARHRRPPPRAPYMARGRAPVRAHGGTSVRGGPRRGGARRGWSRAAHGWEVRSLAALAFCAFPRGPGVGAECDPHRDFDQLRTVFDRCSPEPSLSDFGKARCEFTQSWAGFGVGACERGARRLGTEGTCGGASSERPGGQPLWVRGQAPGDGRGTGSVIEDIAQNTCQRVLRVPICKTRSCMIHGLAQPIRCLPSGPEHIVVSSGIRSS